MSRADDLRKAHRQAAERIAKIGRPERHFTPTSFGGLTSVTVKTTIGHQERPSATNYWEDDNFDAALAIVIKRQFTQLAEAALLLMKLQADEALVSEKTALLERLAQIESIEAGGAL